MLVPPSVGDVQRADGERKRERETGRRDGGDWG